MKHGFENLSETRSVLQLLWRGLESDSESVMALGVHHDHLQRHRHIPFYSDFSMVKLVVETLETRKKIV